MAAARADWLTQLALLGLWSLMAAMPWLPPEWAVTLTWTAPPPDASVLAAMAHRPWAWLTAPLVHLGPGHWLSNLLACSALWFMTALDAQRVRVSMQVLAGWALPQLVLPWSGWSHAMGASGVLHLWLACLACAWRRRAEPAWSRLGAWTLAALLAKVGWEALASSQGQLEGWVAWPMHAAGLAGAWVIQATCWMHGRASAHTPRNSTQDTW